MLSFLGVAINSDNCVDSQAFLQRLSIGDPSQTGITERTCWLSVVLVGQQLLC